MNTAIPAVPAAAHRVITPTARTSGRHHEHDPAGQCPIRLVLHAHHECRLRVHLERRNTRPIPQALITHSDRETAVEPRSDPPICAVMCRGLSLLVAAHNRLSGVWSAGLAAWMMAERRPGSVGAGVRARRERPGGRTAARPGHRRNPGPARSGRGGGRRRPAGCRSRGRRAAPGRAGGFTVGAWGWQSGISGRRMAWGWRMRSGCCVTSCWKHVPLVPDQTSSCRSSR